MADVSDGDEVAEKAALKGVAKVEQMVCVLVP